MRKFFEFCGSPEMLIALLYSDDVCQTIKDEVRASRKVTLFMFAEEEPYYTPDSDDIQITMTGEDIRPKVDLGEPVQIVDDLRFGDVVERDQKENWTEADEERAGVIATNGNDGLHYEDPLFKVAMETLKPFAEAGRAEMKLRETKAHEWMEGDDDEVVGV